MHEEHKDLSQHLDDRTEGAARAEEEAGAPAAAGAPGDDDARAAPALEPAELARRGPRGTFAPQDRLAILRAYFASGQGLRAFGQRYGIDTNTLLHWKQRYEREGEAGLADRVNPRNRAGSTQPAYTPEQRRRLVEAFRASGLSQQRFAATCGLGIQTLSLWLRRYEEHGPKGLEPKPRGRHKSPAPKAVPAALAAPVLEAQRRFPHFGLRKLTYALARFWGIGVPAATVRAVREQHAIATPAPASPRRRKPPLPRRFERAHPGDLWQTDITSFVLTRHSQRVYLTVFLDDHSRYVVSFGLALHQRQELVTEALLEGIARFGKPREVLSDQGRQYYAWRGKSDFQKLLEREGIAHVVARAHHPQTVGKCERLWKTVGEELWDRTHPQDLEEARERLRQYFDHYNHFRPHLSLGGAVPADRFFGAESSVRRAIEQSVAHNALVLALGEEPRRPVFLVGQIGEEAVSLHGERGKLIVQTPSGGRREVVVDALGMAMERREEPQAAAGGGSHE